MGAFCSSHMASGLPRIYLPVAPHSSTVRTEAITVCCYDIRNQLEIFRLSRAGMCLEK